MFRRSILVVCATLLLSGCGSLAAPPSGGNPHVGAQLFVQYGCIGCHAINGRGPKIARDLTNDLSEANYNLLQYFLQTDPPKGMAYTKALPITPRQIADLNAFDNSTLKPPTPVAATPTPTAAARPHNPTPTSRSRKRSPTATPRKTTTAAVSPAQAGARLWVTAKCVDCHQVNGVGGSTAQDLTRSSSMQYASWLALSRNTSQPPGMEYVPSLHLTDQQVRDMSAFAFSSLTPKK